MSRIIVTKRQYGFRRFCFLLLSALTVGACGQSVFAANLSAADEDGGTEPTAVFYVAPNGNSEYDGNGTLRCRFRI